MSDRHDESEPLERAQRDTHGDAEVLARADVGSVSVCACGVITLTLQYISLRLEPGAFRELQCLLVAAQRRLDKSRVHPVPSLAVGPDPVSIH